MKVGAQQQEQQRYQQYEQERDLRRQRDGSGGVGVGAGAAVGVGAVAVGGLTYYQYSRTNGYSSNSYHGSGYSSSTYYGDSYSVRASSNANAYQRAIVVEDVDDATGSGSEQPTASSRYHVELSASKGLLTLAGVTGLAFTRGTGYLDAQLVFSSMDLSHLNAAFGGGMTYTARAGQAGGDDVITVVVTDGNSSHAAKASITVRISGGTE